MLGLINFNLSKNEDGVDGHERMLLGGIADAAAVALENSMLYSRLQELDKLKDEFISLAAHELRAPLTAVKGYSWELLKSNNLAKTEKDYVDRIYKSSDRLANLVSDMLDVSRIESGRMNLKMEKVELDKLVADLCSDFSVKAIEKNIKLNIINMAKTTLTVWADSEKLTQVLINLIGNALKFTPDGGQVDIVFSVKKYYKNYVAFST